jgi:EAL domain-containing protein (putative c-di-GMP-specific phosphodiesterase class I)
MKMKTEGLRKEDWMSIIQVGEVLPFFQPILSIEDKSIFGYESLGRLRTSQGNIVSLGPFFGGDWPSTKYRTDLDRELRRKALIKFSREAPSGTKLFLNVSPRLMKDYLDRKDSVIPITVQLVEELGIEPSRIVIEITEDPLDAHIEVLKPLIDVYKKKGFLIAIDDIGSKSSNLDRIGSFHPDIIKVDMQMLRRSMVDRNYSEIIYNLSLLAQSLGISLLFEGVETQGELEKAMNFGARYIQGYLFREAVGELLERKEFMRKLDDFISEFFQSKTEKMKQKIEWEERIENLLQEIDLENSLESDGSIRNFPSVFAVDPSIRRFYITDDKGNQISPNFVKKSEHIIFMDHSVRQKNWSWRPYFLNHLYGSIKTNNAWVISQPYLDLLENSLLRTFSKTLRDGRILFIDVLYEE